MKKIISLLLTAALMISICACGGSAASGSEAPAESQETSEAESTEESTEEGAEESAEAEGAWSREGYFEDADGRFLSITWMERDDQEFGWYVGYMYEDLMYGNFVSEEGGKLTGNIVPDYEEGEYIVTVSEDGESGVLLETEDGSYPLTVMEMEEAPITAMINTEGYGFFTALTDSEDENAFETEDDFTSTSFVVNLHEPTTYTLTAKPGDEEWEFMKWLKDGEDFSTDPEITVEFSEEMVEYVAVFDYAAAEASSVLDEDTNPVYVKVALNGGWDADFASGAVYIYDQEMTDDLEAVAIGLTLEEEVYNDYREEAEKSGSMREIENGFAYTTGDGTEDYFFTVGDSAYFMIDVMEGADGEDIFSRLTVEAGRGEFEYDEPIRPLETENGYILEIEPGESWVFEYDQEENLYIYDGEPQIGDTPVAVGFTIREGYYDNYREEAEASGTMREVENGFAYTAEDGTEDYVLTVGDQYYMVDIEPGADGEEILKHFVIMTPEE